MGGRRRRSADGRRPWLLLACFALPESGEITRLLRAHEAGDARAFGQLVPLIYAEMRRIARRQLRRGDGPPLDSASLVNDVYLKLAGAELLGARGREHLLAIAASAMRQVLVDRARARLRQKRGGGERPLALEDEEVRAAPSAEPSPEWLIDLDRALTLLRQRDERLARIVECRFFADLSEEETAEALGISPATVKREWTVAKAWLRKALSG